MKTTRTVLKEMAEDIHLLSRNHNDERKSWFRCGWRCMFSSLFLSRFIIAWISVGIVGTISSIMGVVAMIEDKRVRIAKRNLADARQVFNTSVS